MLKSGFVFIFILLYLSGFSQVLNLRDERSFLFEKAYASRNASAHLSMKPLFIKDYNRFADSLYAGLKLTNSPVLNSHLFLKKNDKSSLSLNPVFISDKTYGSSDKTLYMQNGLGFSLKAQHGKKWYLNALIYGFSANYTPEMQARVDSFGILPHYGENFFRVDQRFFSYEADVRFAFKPANYIRFETGKSRHFLGQGRRSLFLSDNAVSLPFVSTVAEVWRIQYRWAFLSGADYDLENNALGRGLYSKYIAFHYLSLNLTERININFFESIVTNAYDQKGRKGPDVHFFNPVIFYRPVEFAAGTYDNALLGLGLNLRLFKRLYLYSQFIIDDMIISEIKNKSGWWGNKYGLQAGFKAYDFLGVENLFILSEINFVRPYTYSHARDNINYGSHRMPLAHPEGANFAEALLNVKYATNRFLYAAELQAFKSGTDTADISFGGDIYRSYTTRNDDYGIEFLQGQSHTKYRANAYISYLLNPKINVSLKLGSRYTYLPEQSFEKHHLMFYLALSSAAFYNFSDGS
jgi:hypothetical protein